MLLIEKNRPIRALCCGCGRLYVPTVSEVGPKFACQRCKLSNHQSTDVAFARHAGVVFQRKPRRRKTTGAQLVEDVKDYFGYRVAL